MTLSLFLLVSAINVSVLLLLVRKRGWSSCEGICALYLLASIVTDNVEVLFGVLFRPDALPLGAQEINLRIYPTIVHILGIGSLLAGLLLVDSHPRPLTRTLDAYEKRRLMRLGIALILIGGTMHGFAIQHGLATGLSQPNVDEYVKETAFVKGGAFLYKGGQIALLGLVLLFVTLRGLSKQVAAIAILVMPTLAYFNKGGLQVSLVFGAVGCSVYQTRPFRQLLRSTVTWAILVPVALIAVMIDIGAKNHYRKRTDIASMAEIFESAARSLHTRYSDDGLYRGYSQLVTYVGSGWADNFHGRMLVYALTSWLPISIHEKPDHPTRDTGRMLYSDHHSYKADASAFTLVGAAYVDFGLTSVVSYLFVFGALLGLIRKVANRQDANIYINVGYVFLSMAGVCSAEAGFLDFFYMIVLTSGVLASGWLLTFMLFPSQSGVGEVRTHDRLRAKNPVPDPGIHARETAGNDNVERSLKDMTLAEVIAFRRAVIRGSRY